MKTFVFSDITPSECYKLLTGVVVPRPIALVTSRSPAGLVNAAPYSFFNIFSEDPPLVVLGLQAKAADTPKDTARNIRAVGEFVINLVDESLAVEMNNCAIDFPPELSEPELLGLSLTPSEIVTVPRLTASPVALECKKLTMMNFGIGRDLVVGEVLALHAKEGVIDPTTLRTNYDNYAPIGRMAGFDFVRTKDRFDLVRETYSDWSKRSDRSEPHI